jgi:hypothetical protein
MRALHRNYLHVRVPEHEAGSASRMPLRRDLRLRTRVHVSALGDCQSGRVITEQREAREC